MQNRIYQRKCIMVTGAKKMNNLALRFVRAAVVYFVFGMLLGMLLVFWPKWPGVVRSIHVHVILSGWVAMVVYAASYTLLPKLTGNPLYSQKLAELHFWFSNGSLVAMSVFWMLVAFQDPGTLMYAFIYALFAIASVLAVVAGIMFAVNMAMTMKDSAEDDAA